MIGSAALALPSVALANSAMGAAAAQIFAIPIGVNFALLAFAVLLITLGMHFLP